MDWYHGNNDVRGTSDNVAAINRSLSFYIARDIPTGEIDQTINWLQSIRQDIDFKIQRLESVKSQRQRAERHRANMNHLARQFYDRDSLHLDIETRQKIVQQRLGCEWHIALKIAEQIHTWAKRERRKQRDQQICLLTDAGMTVAALAAKYELSRQQIHNIVKKRQDNLYYQKY